MWGGGGIEIKRDTDRGRYIQTKKEQCSYARRRCGSVEKNQKLDEFLKGSGHEHKLNTNLTANVTEDFTLQ